MRLDPDGIDQLRIRLPRLICPLGVGNPDVLARIRKETRVDDLNEEVDLRLRAVGEHMGDVSDLCIVPQNVDEHTMEDMDVLRDASILLVISDEIDAHCLWLITDSSCLNAV